MAWPYPEQPPAAWPVAHRLFEPRPAPRPYREYLDQMALTDELGFDWVGCNDPADRERRLQRVREREEATLESEIEHGRALCGSPDTVVERIRQWVRYVGHGVLHFRFQVGTMPHDEVVASMRLFAAEVLPHVRDV